MNEMDIRNSFFKSFLLLFHQDFHLKEKINQINLKSFTYSLKFYKINLTNEKILAAKVAGKLLFLSDISIRTK